MARPRVLLTGFGPFPGAPENPSAWLAETLAAESSLAPDCDLAVRVLPTEWEAVAALTPRLYQELQPHVMIHFGLSQRARCLRIERSAHNQAAPRADAGGALPGSRAIRADGPDRLDTALPASVLAAHLRALGLAATSSPSAGSYLCNFLYYRSLDWASRRDGCLALFVHVPPGPRQGGPFGEAALLHAGQETLSFVLAFADQRDREELCFLPVASPLLPSPKRSRSRDRPRRLWRFGFAQAGEGEADRSSIGREGGRQQIPILPLTPLPDPPPQGGREVSGSFDLSAKDQS